MTGFKAKRDIGWKHGENGGGFHLVRGDQRERPHNGNR
jgi:hypothetical protein